jgi:AAA+ ATPase superfamily predicted ATPase
MFSEQYDSSNSVLSYVNTVVTLVGVVWAIWTAAWHLNFQRATKHLGSLCQDKDVMQIFVADIPSNWRRIFPFFIGKVSAPQVPSISTIIQAGDDGVFTSSMFGSIPSNQNNVSWMPIYESFFLEYAWNLYGSRSQDSAELCPDDSDQPGYLLKYQRRAQEKVWMAVRHAAGEKSGLVNSVSLPNTLKICSRADIIFIDQAPVLQILWTVPDLEHSRDFSRPKTNSSNRSAPSLLQLEYSRQ